MKTNNNNSHLEKILYSAVEREKEPVFLDNRVNVIMDKVNEMSVQTKFETQRLTPKLVFIYGLSIAASVLVGCIIGNVASTSVNALQASAEYFDLINIGFNSLVLPF